MNILVFFIALAVGAVLCFLNYLISKYFLKKHPGIYSAVSVIRQAVNVVYLVLLYIIGEKTELNTFALLLGGALGITLPSVLFTMLLLKLEKGDNDG